MAKRTAKTTKPKRGGNGRVRELFNGSLYELPELLKKVSEQVPETNQAFFNREFHCNIKSLDHANDLLFNGCPLLLDKYLKQSKSIDIKTVSGLDPVYMPSVEGLYYSVPAYLEGQPEHWVNLEFEAPENRVQDLYINVSASHRVTEDLIFEKLINIVKYIDQNEAAGNRFNIYICFHCSPSEEVPDQSNVSFKVKIKNASDPVNLQQLVYLIASPFVLRFVFFMLNTPHATIKFSGIYYNNSIAEISYLNNPDIVYIPSFYYDKSHYISDYNNLTEVYPHLN